MTWLINSQLPKMMTGTQHVFDVLDTPLAQPPTGVCAVFGGERFLKKLTIDFLVDSIGNGDEDFAASQYDSENATWADIHDELSTRSLFGGDGPKIVVVDHADKFVKENRDRIEDHVDLPSHRGLLILVVESWASNTKLYKKIDKRGLQVRCDPPTKSTKSKQRDDKKTADWLVARANDVYEFQLPSGGAQLLIELTESEFGRMDQELQKLALYADTKGKLTQETIKKVVGGWRSRTMWEAIDAAADGEAGRALELLDQLLRSGEHPLAAVWPIVLVASPLCDGNGNRDATIAEPAKTEFAQCHQGSRFSCLGGRVGRGSDSNSSVG